MIFLSIYTWDPEHRDAAIARFKETGARPPAGIKLLNRWFAASGGRGFALIETDDATHLNAFVLGWFDLMRFELVPVLDEAQVAKALAG